MSLRRLTQDPLCSPCFLRCSIWMGKIGRARMTKIVMMTMRMVRERRMRVARRKRTTRRRAAEMRRMALDSLLSMATLLIWKRGMETMSSGDEEDGPGLSALYGNTADLEE